MNVLSLCELFYENMSVAMIISIFLKIFFHFFLVFAPGKCYTVIIINYTFFYNNL